MDALGHPERNLRWRSGQWREFWGMPTYTGHCRGRTHWRESRVFGEEDRALEGCGITGSKEAEVKKAGVGTGGGSGPVQ